MSFFFNDTAPTEIYSLSLHDALPIYVAHDDPQPQSDLAPVDARRRTHVHEVSAVVAIQLGPAERVPNGACVLQLEVHHWPGRVVDYEQVEIAVAVVVEEHRLSRVARVGHAVGRGLLDEGRDTGGVQPLVDVQLVGPEPAISEPGVADVDVEPSIAVHIRQGDACGPRSEEHTSELQSQSNLVCRLLPAKQTYQLCYSYLG